MISALLYVFLNPDWTPHPNPTTAQAKEAVAASEDALKAKEDVEQALARAITSHAQEVASVEALLEAANQLHAEKQDASAASLKACEAEVEKAQSLVEKERTNAKLALEEAVKAEKKVMDTAMAERNGVIEGLKKVIEEMKQRAGLFEEDMKELRDELEEERLQNIVRAVSFSFGVVGIFMFDIFSFCSHHFFFSSAELQGARSSGPLRVHVCC